MQEVHYGPWGEILEGIGVTGDWKFLFQGKEYVSDFGANLYDFHSRGYDPYLGRFWQIDGANQFASGYVGMGNMPTMGVDPDGQFVWFVWAGAAAIGGASNLYSNWSKVKDWKTGLAYFGSGAIGGAVSLTGAGFWGGTATTATLNVGIDVATGNLPNLKSFGDYAEYGLFTGLSGMSGGGAGSISKFAFGGGIRSFFTWMQKPYFNPQPGFAAVKNNATGVLEKVSWAAEAGVQSTKVPLGSLAANAAKQGLSKAANLNTNAAKGNFGIYEILKDGQLYKYGKADLGRVTKSSGLPTRLHQQVRKLQGQFEGSEVFGRVVEDLGTVSTKSARGVENAYLNFFYKTTGKIPVGNSKSFFPR